MKKFIFLALAVIFSMISGFGQTTFKLSNGEGFMKSTVNHATTDTITNAVTKNQFVQIDGFNDVASIQPTFTKISGTAAATVKLQESVDGVSYNDVSGATYTVTDVATQSTVFKVTNPACKFYRLNIVPTGTQSVKVKTPVIVRKR